MLELGSCTRQAEISAAVPRLDASGYRQHITGVHLMSLPLQSGSIPSWAAEFKVGQDIMLQAADHSVSCIPRFPVIILVVITSCMQMVGRTCHRVAYSQCKLRPNENVLQARCIGLFDEPHYSSHAAWNSACAGHPSLVNFVTMLMNPCTIDLCNAALHWIACRTSRQAVSFLSRRVQPAKFGAG